MGGGTVDAIPDETQLPAAVFAKQPERTPVRAAARPLRARTAELAARVTTPTGLVDSQALIMWLRLSVFCRQKQ